VSRLARDTSWVDRPRPRAGPTSRVGSHRRAVPDRLSGSNDGRGSGVQASPGPSRPDEPMSPSAMSPARARATPIAIVTYSVTPSKRNGRRGGSDRTIDFEASSGRLVGTSRSQAYGPIRHGADDPLGHVKALRSVRFDVHPRQRPGRLARLVRTRKARREDPVGLAMLVVPEQLTPAERLAFVLNDVRAAGGPRRLRRRSAVRRPRLHDPGWADRRAGHLRRPKAPGRLDFAYCTPDAATLR
jgi:hypothetical protein